MSTTASPTATSHAAAPHAAASHAAALPAAIEFEAGATQVQPVVAAFLAPRSITHSGRDFCIVADSARTIAIGRVKFVETATKRMLDDLIGTYRGAGYTVYRMSDGTANVDSLTQATEFRDILTAITQSDQS